MRFSRLTISLRRVSIPIHTKAREKKNDEKFFAIEVSASFLAAKSGNISHDCSRLNTAEARTKPRTNLGNFSQTIRSYGR